MLTELYALLIALLTEAGFTAYAEDTVPQAAAFPFVTCRIGPPMSMHGTGSVTLTCHVRGDAPHEQRLAMADALIRLVPPGGMTLPLMGGLAALFRAEGQAVTWPEERGALGACVRHELRVFGGR